MQRYSFDLANEKYPLDLQGIKFSSVVDAEAEARSFADKVYCDRSELALTKGEFRVEVTDPNHAILFTVITTARSRIVQSDDGASLKLITDAQAGSRIPPMPLSS